MGREFVEVVEVVLPPVPVQLYALDRLQLLMKQRQRPHQSTARAGRHCASASALFCAAEFAVEVLLLVALGVPARDEPATRRQPPVEAHWLQGTRSEKVQPCDRHSPGWVPAPPLGGRHGLPEAAQYSVPAPDSLQIVPGLNLA